MQTIKISSQAKKILPIIILAVLISIAGFLWIRQSQPSINTNVNANENVNEESQPLQKYIMLSFQFDNDRKTELQYPCKKTEQSPNCEENLLLITQNISREQNWSLASKDYDDMGTLVTQINDKLNGSEQKYWQYFADFKQPLISVDKFYPAPGQLIEWKFIKSEF